MVQGRLDYCFLCLFTHIYEQQVQALTAQVNKVQEKYGICNEVIEMIPNVFYGEK